MTITQRYLGEFKDVLAVRIVCKCGASVSIPVKHNYGLPGICSNCRNLLLDPNSREYGLLDTLMRGIVDLAGTKYPWTVQLEFAPPQPTQQPAS
jgi:hypothetical protein